MTTLTIGLLAGGALGALVAVLWLRGVWAHRTAAAETLAAEEKNRRIALEGDLRLAQEARSAAATALAVAERDRDQVLREVEEQRAFLEKTRADLENAFQALASKALEGNTTAFLKLAEERFTRVQGEAKDDLEKRQTAIQALVEPLKETLGKLEEKTGELEKNRQTAYARLGEQVEQLLKQTVQLQEKTVSLDTALRGVQVRGRWGEIALRNIAELSGMTEHCDFELQRVLDDRSRPDMVVHLPGDRQIAVDAKAPLTAYLAAMEETSEDRRQEYLDQHVRDLRGHIRALAARNYAEILGGEVDLVVLFLPGDPFLAAAFSRDPDLQTEALKHRVIVATPATLVALLRTVAIYWQQESLARNAADIADVARTLYTRVGKFREHVENVGKKLGGAVEAYNRAVNSFQSRVVPMGRRLEEMRVAPAGELEDLDGIDDVPRTYLVEGDEEDASREGGAEIPS